MYNQHWGLKQSPFGGSDRAFYDSAAQEEALARIDYLISQNRRLGILTGRDGVGKTTLLNHVAYEAKRRRSPSTCINALGMDQQEFVMNVAQSLGAIHHLENSPAVVWRKLFDRFQTNRFQHLDTLIVVDDAHEAESEVLNAIVRFVQWYPAAKSRVTVLLSANTDRVELLGTRLLQLSDLNIELEPWDQEDTIGYIRFALEQAGAERELFDVRAVEEIQRLSEGVPRRVVQLAELALVAGAGQELDRIDADTISAVDDELRVPVAG